MSAAIWKGHLTFGLVSVPVRLYAAARVRTVNFNLLHESCGSRIKQQVFCPVHERVVERSELVRGAEVGEGRYVLISDADLEQITPPSGHTIDVLEFVKLEEVDAVYLDTSYFTVPEEAGQKAYYLLQQVLERTGYVGVARVVLHQREHIVVVRSAMGGLMMHTIYYQDEVRAVEDYGKTPHLALSAQELEMGQMFVQALATTFDPTKYQDQYRENVMQLIAARAEGQTVTVPEQPAAAAFPDLMAALKASIEQGRSLPHPSGAVEPISIEMAPSHPKRRRAAAKVEQPVAPDAATPRRDRTSARRRQTG